MKICIEFHADISVKLHLFSHIWINHIYMKYKINIKYLSAIHVGAINERFVCIFRRTLYLLLRLVCLEYVWWRLLISVLHKHNIPSQHTANASVSARNIASLKTLNFYQFFHFCVLHWCKLFTVFFLPTTLSPVHVSIHSYSILNLLVVIRTCLWSHSRLSWLY